MGIFGSHNLRRRLTAWTRAIWARTSRWRRAAGHVTGVFVVVVLVAWAVVAFLLTLPAELRYAWVAVYIFVGLLTAMYVRLTGHIAMQPRLTSRLEAVRSAMRHVATASDTLQQVRVQLQVDSFSPDSFVDPTTSQDARQTLREVRHELDLLQSVLPKSMQNARAEGHVSPDRCEPATPSR